jgi:hypothetical protein
VIEARNYVSFAELGRKIPGFTAEKDSVGDAVWWLATKFGWEVYVGLTGPRVVTRRIPRPRMGTAGAYCGALSHNQYNS